jgi:hypothetical protein
MRENVFMDVLSTSISLATRFGSNAMAPNTEWPWISFVLALPLNASCWHSLLRDLVPLRRRTRLEFRIKRNRAARRNRLNLGDQAGRQSTETDLSTHSRGYRIRWGSIPTSRLRHGGRSQGVHSRPKKVPTTFRSIAAVSSRYRKHHPRELRDDLFEYAPNRTE